jgi:hypothetical protein
MLTGCCVQYANRMETDFIVVYTHLLINVIPLFTREEVAFDCDRP